MTDNLGLDVSRVLSPELTGFESIVWQKKRPPLDSELNLLQALPNKRINELVADTVPSGILSFKLNPAAEDFVVSKQAGFPSMATAQYQVAIPNFRAIVNGWTVDVVASRYASGVLVSMDYNTIQLPPAPSVGQRQDLVFLEVWRSLVAPNPSTGNKPDATHVWPYGNVLYKGTTIVDDIMDTSINRMTTKRVQVQYRIRVVEGVNLTQYKDGVDDPTVKAQAGSGSATSYVYSLHKRGLFRAGDGTTLAQDTLGSVDGYVYAIPLFVAHRRNSTAYAVNLNPNGSAVSLLSSNPSDRPDGLFYDEVARQDILDLRKSVSLTGWDKKRLLEKAFQDLSHGKLKSAWSKDYNGSSYGSTSILRVDGISVSDQVGVYDFAQPDGYRRSWGDAKGSQVSTGSFTQGTTSTGGGVAYNSTGDAITITAQAGGTIDVAPTMVWVNTGNTAAITGSWVGLGTGVITANLNSGDANYQLAKKVAVSFEETFGEGEGLTHSPVSVFKVYNNHASNPAEWGYVTTDAPIRSVPITSISTVAGFPDIVDDYRVDTVPFTRGHSRLLTMHLPGNGTAVYTIPATMYGRPVLGILQVEQASNSNPTFTTLNPTSVVLGGVGTITITLPTIYTPTDYFRIKVVLGQYDVTLDKLRKEVVETTITELVTFSVTASNEAIVDAGSLVKTVAHITTNLGTNPYVYDSTGNLIKLNSAVAYGNQLKLTFSGLVTGTFRIPVVRAYAPQSGDRLQIYYSHLPYQGAWYAGLLQNAEVVALGDPLVHTLGSDTTVSNLPPSVSSKLPLGVSLSDGLLKSSNITVLSQGSGPWVDLNPLRNNQIYLGQGRHAKVGNLLKEETIPGLPPTPARGVKEVELWVKENDLEAILTVETPALGSSGAHEVVYHALAKTSSGELVMVVLTKLETSSGGNLLEAKASSSSSWDVFYLPGRPIEW